MRLDMQNSSQQHRRNSAPEGWRKTARHHHPNPAEATRRWRGERSKPVRLGVRGHHTRSVCAESPAQTEQWCCWLCRRRIILIERDRGQFVPSRRMMANVRAERLLEIPGRTQPRAAYLRHCSSNASGLQGRNSAGSPQIYATFQRDNLRISEFESHMPSQAVGLCRCGPCLPTSITGRRKTVTSRFASHGSFKGLWLRF